MGNADGVNPKGSLSHLPALDGLRAVAVLAVVFYHLDYRWARGGFLGVDTFFVLSGFLITSLLLIEYGEKGSISLGGFWARRARRLLPAVMIVLLAVAGYAAIYASSDRLGELRGDGLSTLFYVANWRSILAGASYFDLYSEASPLRHMWSLAIEEQFYLLWPLLAFGALRIGRGRLRILAVASILGVFASVWVMATLWRASDPSRAYYGTDARAHALLVGVLLAIFVRHRAIAGRIGFSGRFNAVLQAAGVVAGLGMVWSFGRVSDTGEDFYKGGSLLFAGSVALVIAAATAVGPSPLKALLSVRPLRWLGEISYGLYLWHWPLIVWLSPRRTGLEGNTLDLLRVSATLALTTASFYLLERQVRHGKLSNRRLAVGVPIAFAVCATLLVAGTLGATTNRFDAQTPLTLPPMQPIPSGETGPPVTSPEGKLVVRSLAVVGDSVAVTIADGLGPAAERTGIRFLSGAFPGCGIAAGYMLTDDGDPFDWTEPCLGAGPGLQRDLVRDFDPDVVVWHSTWEMTDRRENGLHLKAMTKAHDEALLAEMEVAYGRLSAGGARVVFLLVVPRGPGEILPAEDGSDGKVAHYNELMQRFSAEHPDNTAVVDLNKIVCPDGPPCPEKIDGVILRPDGGHYTLETSPWLAERLLPAILSSLDAEPPSTP